MTALRIFFAFMTFLLVLCSCSSTNNNESYQSLIDHEWVCEDTIGVIGNSDKTIEYHRIVFNKPHFAHSVDTKLIQVNNDTVATQKKTMGNYIVEDSKVFLIVSDTSYAVGYINQKKLFISISDRSGNLLFDAF